MRQVKMRTLLDVPGDDVAFQREWTTKGQRGIFLEIAFLAGTVGPGLYMISSLYRFRLGLLVGFLIVLIGYAVPHGLFLGRMERSWRAALRPQSSWISRGFIFASLFLVFGCLSVAHYIPALDAGPLRPDSTAFGAILVAGAVSAFLLAVYPGFLFSVVRAIPSWHSVTLIPLFVAQAFGGGLSLTLILIQFPGVTGPAIASVLPLATVAVAAAGTLTVAHLHSRRKGDAASRAAVERLLRGAYRALFLYGALLGGIVAPFLLIVLAHLGIGRAVLAVAAALLQVSGVLLFKYCLLNAGAYSPLGSGRLIGPDSQPSQRVRP